MPFWVIVLGWPFLGERLRGWQWPAVGLALVGLILVLQVWHSGANLANSLIALGAGCSWGISVIIVKKIPVSSRGELMSLTTWQMLFGLIPLAAATIWFPQPPVEWSSYFIGAVIYNAVGGTMLAWLLWLYILQKLPATVSGLSSLIIPIIGVAAAWLQLGEQPDLAEGIGIVLILAGLALLPLAGRGDADRVNAER
jgi:drug/metabolite transporter (DMT)-like permease